MLKFKVHSALLLKSFLKPNVKPIRFKGLSMLSIVCAVKFKEKVFSDAMPSINAEGG